jgi:pyridoxal 5'-phosphate synthase pdxT subunit
MRRPTVGVLALQGDVREHAAAVRALGATAEEVRDERELADVDALVIPGGESTTISHLLRTAGLRDALVDRLRAGLPVLGTCAGLILLASEIVDGRSDQETFDVIDVTVRRNGFGRQVDSFETPLTVDGIPTPVAAAFIRAPRIERVGPDVDVLAELDGEPVLVRQGAALGTTFHPEVTGDPRIHELLLAQV